MKNYSKMITSFFIIDFYLPLFSPVLDGLFSLASPMLYLFFIFLVSGPPLCARRHPTHSL